MFKQLYEYRNGWLLNGKEQPAGFHKEEMSRFERKVKMYDEQQKEVVKIKSRVHIAGKHEINEWVYIHYVLHDQWVIREKRSDHFYVEEFVEKRCAIFENQEFVSDQLMVEEPEDGPIEQDFSCFDEEPRISYTYDRMKAVQYAERWWNDYNPAFKAFPVDCTNYISQCLYAGGAPMWGFASPNRGWWYKQNKWSYSWTVAHALRWHLSGTKQGLRASAVEQPWQLELGDVICYDFSGDGRFDHTTIVVSKDHQGMPLVNAHTTNSRMRYYSYEDSYAWTEKITYKFFHILDQA